MRVEELELAISRLSRDDLARLAEWFAEFHAEMWDRQFETDVKAGKLDRLARQAKKDLGAGKCNPF